MVEPITDDQLWGTVKTAETVCPLMDDSKCPPGCDECVKFAEDYRLTGVRDD